MTLLTDAGRDQRLLRRKEKDALREVGGQAARSGVSLGDLADAYLGATFSLWPTLSRGGTGRSATAAAAANLMKTAQEAVVALARGYEAAQLQAIRDDEAMRREFIDDLLGGVADPGLLPERASQIGLALAGTHVVAVARVPRDTAKGRQVETDLLQRFDGHHVLVARKAGLLVCVTPSHHDTVVADFAAQVITSAPKARVGIGRPQQGPAGVARSFHEAKDALDLADRLGLDEPVASAADLLVYQVLLRDRAAISDLVDTVLGPLRDSRTGAQPLVETLSAYFRTGNAVAAARQLHVAVRTVTYRLERVQRLTGYGPTQPAHRFTLEAAVLGAQLLGWPSQPLE